MKVAVVLPGLHKVVRGAEVAFESISNELAHYEDVEVTLFGSGEDKSEATYHFCHVDSIPREKFESLWPHNIPVFRNENNYEELTFVFNLFRKYDYKNFDITLTCSYPLINWYLVGNRRHKNPHHIFVTQNSDYMVHTPNREFRFFKCDGLVCTNPEYFERNKHRKEWLTTLIPNGVDPQRFNPGVKNRGQFQLPEDAPVALMVSALIEEKRVLEGIKAAAQVPDLHLVICGDGPMRDTVKAQGQTLMGDRFHLKKLPFSQMPDIYRTADLFMHLSMTEPFGNVYIEALATGLPIVAHERNVTRWIVEDHAVLVDTTQTSEIVRGIHRALNHDQDEEKVLDRVNYARHRFSWKSLAQKYYDFMKQVIEVNESNKKSI